MSQTVVTTGNTITRSGTLDTDEVWIHQDDNCAKLKKLVSENAGKVEMARGCCGLPSARPVPGEAPSNAVGLLRSLVTGTSATELCVKYGIETARDYALRSRQGLNGLRQYAQPVP